MAANPQLKYSSVEPYQRVIPPTNGIRTKSRQYSFTIGQLIVSWSVCAGLMAATFFFGLYAGKERGMQLALEEQARLALRVPLPERPVPDVGPLGKALEAQKATDNSSQQPVKLAAGSETPANEAIKKTPKQSIATLPATSVAAPPSSKSVVANVKMPAETIADRVKRTEVAKAEAPKQKPIRGVEKPKPTPKPKAKAKPVGAAAPTKVAISKSVKSGYYVQVSAKRSPEAAQKLAGSLSGAKYGVSIEQTKVSGKQFYRVLVGPYKSAKLAKSRQKRLVQAGLSPKNSFVKRVN